MPLTAINVAAAEAKLEAMLEAIVARVAFDVESRAKQAAPVDTGNLRASIGTRKLGKLEHEVAASAHYAAYVELGTRYMTAQPLWDPLESTCRHASLSIL